MSARVQIEIEANDRASAILRGITGQFGSLGGAVSDLSTLMGANNKVAQLSAYAMEAVSKKSKDADAAIAALSAAEDEQHAASVRLTQALTSLAVEGLKMAAQFASDAYKEFQAYAQSVRDVALASGQTAEEASRMLQVLDDFQLTAQDVTAATKAMTRQGLTPNLETLAQLSDQYKNITDAQERNEFVIKNLGRAGLQWTNVLQQGGDALRDMAGEVDKNLILNDQMIKNSEKERLAMDALSDAWLGFKVQVGAAVGEMILAQKQTSDLRDEVRKYAEEQGITITNQQQARQIADMLREREAALEAQMEHNAAAADFYTRQMGLHNDVMEKTAVNYKDLIGSIMSYQNELDRYNETNDEILAKEQDLLSQKAELEAQYASLTEWQKKYTSEGKKIPEQLNKIDKELGDNGKALKKSEEDFKRWSAQTVYAFAQARAAADGSISEIEGEILVDAGEALGLFDEKTAETMRKVNDAFDSLDTENAQAVIATLKAQLYELTHTPYVVNVDVNVNPWTGPSSTSVESSTSPQPVQTGGRVMAGQPYTVGESGPESFVPAVNGRILGHAEALHAMSLGAGGGTNIFYGNVELVLSAEGAEGLLSLR